MSGADGEHLHYLRVALDQAARCEPTPTAFCVGAVLVVRHPSQLSTPLVLSTGYSRELPGNTHAEANALAKACDLTPAELSAFPSQDVSELLRHVDCYTTLEPCSVRTSGLAPCADALIAAHIKRCVIGVGEPDDFVKCEGAQRLVNAGVEVIWVKGLEDECLKAARRGHSDKET
ncbi:cytidine deaminase-like protein [Vararia minispora EC-137]|uniref:Cytidine deaminase-like protein n=1 Tax=Vararia minispora EC-137 TaxID=1314806 RepID=A0ACB8Q824_9AGAM|nr:cytidine deaminase-like protein [Vararia minispora EC-137]